MKRKISVINGQHIEAIDKHEHAINYTTTEIAQHIQNIYNLLNSDDAIAVYDYISRNEEFRSLPAQSQLSLPTFTPHEIREQIYQQIVSMSETHQNFPSTPLINNSAVKTKGNCSPIKDPVVVIPPQARPLIDDPAISTEEYDRPKKSPGAVSTPQAKPFNGYQPIYCSPKSNVVVSPQAKTPTDDPNSEYLTVCPCVLQQPSLGCITIFQNKLESLHLRMLCANCGSRDDFFISLMYLFMSLLSPLRKEREPSFELT